MAFDAGMLSAVIHEIKMLAEGGRIEKIYQPEKDEIHLQMRTLSGGKRMLINAGSNNPRISFTSVSKENPPQAPMLCMLLRKHLSGATLSEIRQVGFERVAILGFDTRDEMGYECKKYLIAEIMGKYSNLIFTDGDMRVISALKTIDFTTSSLRQVLPGMKYELPPAQNKLIPLDVTKDEFLSLISDIDSEKSAEKFITSNFVGIASCTAREIAYRAASRTLSPDSLWKEFSALMDSVKRGEYSPCVVFDGKTPIEYCYTRLTHYKDGIQVQNTESPSEALDIFFESRDKEQRVRQRAADLLKILAHSETRIIKKLDAQQNELAECELGTKYKKYGDLITSNMYQLSRGQTSAELIDYESWNEETEDFERCIIELDERLSPAANAQKYYKKYNKLKNAKVELTKQIEIGRRELEYVYSVFDALSKAENTADLSEIREELYRSGYASRMKGYAAPKKQHAPTVAEFRTTNGYRVLCGKNNLQNEYITHKLADKLDYWFHAKNTAGSHVLMITDGDEPPAEDFTDACEIAAYYSKNRGGVSVAVDYLFAKGVKKVVGAKPGFVIYHSNWTAYVTPDEEKIRSMRVK